MVMNNRHTEENVDVWSGGDTLFVELSYPRYSKINKIEINLSDVRAADGVRVSYDYDRDGWIVKQASTFEWDSDDDECDSDWQEVAFIKAWAREADGSGE